MDRSGEIYAQDQKAYYKASFYTTIKLVNKNGNPLRLSTGEKLIFGVKRAYTDTTYLLKKVLTSADELDGEYTVSFSPTDMNNANVVPGLYYYDVSVQYPDGSLIKVIPRSRFLVIESETEVEVSS